MNRSNTLTGALVLIAMLIALPQLAFGQENNKIVGSGTEYRVVINHEEQYSIWLAGKEIPRGWKATGFVGSKAGALKHIEEVWTDMRPVSERRKIAEQIYRQQQRKK